MTSIAIVGAAGRMGLRLIALGNADAELNVSGAIEREGHPMLGRDAGELAGVGPIGVAVSADLQQTPQAIIDFSAPASTRRWLATCAQRGMAIVVGTTGLGPEDHAAIDTAAKRVAVLQSPNMSLGVNLLFKVAAQMARTLGDDYDIEIVEGHHRFKKDAPSGTAMGIAESVLRATGKSNDALIFDRHGSDCPRERGQIGMHSLRMGDEVGKHSVYFAALGERLELGHVATNRDTFAQGALRCAKWVGQQKPGRYTVADMLEL